MNKKILDLAVPNIISNISIPLLGIVDMALMGHLESDAYIGAIALGSLIFNFIYWGLGFLRMGTSGFTAQAWGRRDLPETILVLSRAVFIALAIIASLSVGLWLSALSAIYRDFRYVIPFIVQLGMFASPVVYATANIREKLPTWAVALYGLNPMAGVIEGFRWALMVTSDPPGLMFLASLLMTGLLFTGAMYYFRRLERTFADVI